MYTYSTNMMGPMTHWYDTNQIPYTLSTRYSTLFCRTITTKVYDHHWYGGRIDIYGGEGYPIEAALPIMRDDSYGAFSDWLSKLSTLTPLYFSELRSLFEQSNPPLILFEEHTCTNSTT